MIKRIRFVPNVYVEYLDMKESDELNWETRKHGGKRFLIVTKATDKESK